MNWSLYVITDDRLCAGCTLTEVVRAAIRGGASVVQYRDKTATTRQMVEDASALWQLCREARVPLIINDRVDVALAVGADGVHLGTTDMPVAVARRILGPDKLIGYSPETLAQARAGEADGADYLGVGSIFGTATKRDAGPPIGLAGLKQMIAAVSVPVVGIGGITALNAPEVIRAGAEGVAVVSAVVGAENVEDAAQRLCAAVDASRRVGGAASP
jgi:thiamine-phosphate pyrophosphorylase